jgi:hypothetical protein
VRLKTSSIPSVISSGFALLALAACSVNGGSSGVFDSGKSTFTPETIRKFSDHPVYWLGTQFERWDLSRILGPYRAGGTISFIYGDVLPGAETNRVAHLRSMCRCHRSAGISRPLRRT